MNRDATAALIKKHEGERQYVYRDAMGKLTIGVGFNLERPGAEKCCNQIDVDYKALCAGDVALTAQQMDLLFNFDLDDAIKAAAGTVSSFWQLPDDVQGVCTDMAFNLGPPGFSKFVNMIAALEKDPPDYCGAATEMRSSRWAQQVTARANDDIALVSQFCGGG